jgi:zinc finger SWIM domain-containing protein 3
LKLSDPKHYNDAQELIKAMENDVRNRKICSFEYHANEESVLEYAFWQTEKMKEIFNAYCNVISIDSTFNLNRSGYALNIIITIDASKDTRIVAFGLVTSDKRTDIIKAFFEWFNKNNPNYINLKTILTDKNQSQIDVLRNIYPNIDISLCLYHVFKAMRLETHRKLPNYVLEEIRGIFSIKKSFDMIYLIFFVLFCFCY